MDVNSKIGLVGKIKWREEYDFYTVYQYETDCLFKVPNIAIQIFELANKNNSINTIINTIIKNNNLNINTYDKIKDYIMLLNQKELIEEVK